MSSCVLFADYTRGTSRNLAREYSDTVVTNGTFDSDVAGWGVDNATLSWNAGGYCEIVNTGGVARIKQSPVLTIGKRYRITFKAKSSISTQPYFHAAHMSGVVYTHQPNYTTEWQVYEFYGTALTTTFYIYLNITLLGEQVDIDNISVQEVLESEDTDILYKHGLGAEFNGASSFIDYGNTSLFSISTEDYAIEFVSRASKEDNTAQPWGTVYSRGSIGVGQHFVYYRNVNAIRWYYDGAQGAILSVPNVTLYNHFILQRLGGVVQVYLNGNLAYNTTPAVYSLDVDKPLEIGVRGSISQWLSGHVKYFRLSKGRAFTAEEARQNYQAAIDSGYLNG